MADRRVRRVLYSDDPRGDDYREAQEWVRDLRSRLVYMRGELEDVARIEARFPHDSLCGSVAGSLTLALIALHQLIEGERSFAVRAERVDELWKEVAADQDGFVIKHGSDWNWRPYGIYNRGGLQHEHPEVREAREDGARCALCGGGAYPPWLTDDETWCRVMGDSHQQVCLPCFYARAETRGDVLWIAFRA